MSGSYSQVEGGEKPERELSGFQIKPGGFLAPVGLLFLRHSQMHETLASREKAGCELFSRQMKLPNGTVRLENLFCGTVLGSSYSAATNPTDSEVPNIMERG